MAENQDKTKWESDFPEEEDLEEARLRRQWEKQQELKNAQREKRLKEQKRKLRAIAILAGIAVGLIVLVTVLTVKVFVPLGKYNHANKLLENGSYAKAIVAFRNMEGYKDSDARMREAIRLQAVALSGNENVYYETSETVRWFSIDEKGNLKFDEDKYKGDFHIVIPDVFDGVLVTGIDGNAFFHCDRLQSITISECVLTIGTRAFLGCTSLKEITLPSHLESLGESAFSGCTALRTVTFGNELREILQNAFADCISLTAIELPDSLLKLDARVFNTCTALETVSIGAGIETFGNYVFSGCSALKTLTYRGTNAEWEALKVNPARTGLESVAIVCYADGEE